MPTKNHPASCSTCFGMGRVVDCTDARHVNANCPCGTKVCPDCEPVPFESALTSLVTAASRSVA